PNSVRLQDGNRSAQAPAVPVADAVAESSSSLMAQVSAIFLSRSLADAAGAAEALVLKPSPPRGAGGDWKATSWVHSRRRCAGPCAPSRYGARRDAKPATGPGPREEKPARVAVGQGKRSGQKRIR